MLRGILIHYQHIHLILYFLAKFLCLVYPFFIPSTLSLNELFIISVNSLCHNIIQFSYLHTINSKSELVRSAYTFVTSHRSLQSQRGYQASSCLPYPFTPRITRYCPQFFICPYSLDKSWFLCSCPLLLLLLLWDFFCAAISTRGDRQSRCVTCLYFFIISGIFILTSDEQFNDVLVLAFSSFLSGNIY